MEICESGSLTSTKRQNSRNRIFYKTGDRTKRRWFQNRNADSNMTKHFLPDELVGTDYERPNLNGTITVMRERLRDSGEFFGIRTFDVSEDTGRPVMSGTQPLNDGKESPEYVSKKWAWNEREKHFDKEQSEEEAETDSEKDSFEEDGKRLVRTRPRCNRNASTAPWSNIQITKKFKDDCADEPCSHFALAASAHTRLCKSNGRHALP
jgi:hypothetical protein